jgi:hypothetical protein
LNQCWSGFHDVLERGWELLPFWLVSAVRGKEDTRPFRSYIAPYTLRRYIGYWQGYIMFCVRIYQVDNNIIQFTDEQQDHLRRVGMLMHERTTASINQLHLALLELSVSLICHSDYSHVKSSLVYFTGVCGYNVDWKQWRPPQDYTPILAGLQFCIRIIMLEAALPREERNEFNENSEMTPIDCFCAVHDKWLIDGESMSHLI